VPVAVGPLVFVSYARSDDERADGAIAAFVKQIEEELAERLPDLGVHVFLDRRSVRAGEVWASAIADGAAHAAVFLPFISPAWGARPWCRQELDLFSSRLDSSDTSSALIPLYWDAWDRPADGPGGDSLGAHQQVFKRNFVDLRVMRTQGPASPEASAMLDVVVRRVAEVLEGRTSATPRLAAQTRAPNFSAKFVAVVDELTNRHPAGHPIQVFVEAAVDGLTDDMREGGSDLIEVAAAHYRHFLRADKLRNALNPKARAVADLTDATEEFWSEAAGEPDPWVRERLFLLTPQFLTDLGELDNLLPVFDSQHARGIDVYLSDAPLWWSTVKDHHFGSDGKGAHLLLVGEDLVGGYVSRGKSVRLRLHRKQTLFKRMSSHLDAIVERSVRYVHGMTPSEIRAEWVRQRRIGHWGQEWAQMSRRPQSFFDYYAQHVACWIPDYPDLIRSCAGEVQRQLIRQLRTSDGPLAVLELGVGTGVLTREIVEWANAINEPFRLAPAPVAIGRVSGLEPAQRLQLRTWVEKLRSQFPSVELELVPGAWPGTALSTFSPNSLACICGSLVLHHIIQRGTESEFMQFLNGCARLLSGQGALVFADSFHAEGSSKYEESKAWRAHMAEFGLPEAEIERFMKGNREMGTLPDRATIDRCGAAAGFHPCQLLASEVQTGDVSQPFRVLVMQRM
jgi:TIR domain